MTTFRSRTACFLSLGLLLAAALAGGCSDNPNEGVVKFESTPTGANVKIDGTPAGQTPLSAVLGKKQETQITFEKAGFAPQNIPVRPRGGELTPNPVKAALVPELMPTTREGDPKVELAKRIEIVRQNAAMGRITEVDRVYIEAKLVEFYGVPAPAAK
jgi:hypothetical protein